VVDELERRAGRCLLEIQALGWPPSRQAAESCGIRLRDFSRLRNLVTDEPRIKVSDR
jgi:hypothetical protein